MSSFLAALATFKSDNSPANAGKLVKHLRKHPMAMVLVLADDAPVVDEAIRIHNATVAA